MKPEDLTQWHESTVKPVHVGEYNASWRGNETARRWWDGERWSMAYSDATPAPFIWQFRRASTDDQSIRWRGLRVKPEGMAE